MLAHETARETVVFTPNKYTYISTCTLYRVLFELVPYVHGKHFYSVLRPFQDYFSLYERGQSVGGAKTGEHREKTPGTAHPQAELGLSHM